MVMASRLLVGTIVALAYESTVSPYVSAGDAAELAGNACALTVPHPPG